MAIPKKLKLGQEADEPQADFQGGDQSDLGEAPPYEVPPDVRARQIPNLPSQDDLTQFDPTRPGRGAETPRERGNTPAAPRKPMSPDPMAAAGGSTFQAGVLPFKPLPGPMGSSPSGSLFGSMGGLKGGGLGIPLDPVSDVASDPIDTLIQLLMRGR